MFEPLVRLMTLGDSRFEIISKRHACILAADDTAVRHAFAESGTPTAPSDIYGDLALPIDPPPPCRFYDRRPISTDRCRYNPHSPSEKKTPGHQVACYEALRGF